MKTKICSQCHEEKSTEEFHKQKQGRFGVCSICKVCSIENRHNYYHFKGGKEKRHNAHVMSLKNNYEKILLANTKSRAKKCKLECSLVLSDIIIPKKCPILGIDLCVNANNNGPSDNSPSVDRIDNKKGYTKDNIIIISNRANRIKNKHDIEDLVKVREYLLRLTLKS